MGGGAKMLLRLLQGLNKERFDITLISQRDDELCRHASELGLNIKIIPYPGVLDMYGGGLWGLPTYQKAVVGARLLQYNWRFSRQIETPDVIWCAGTRPFMMLLPYLQFTNATSIWNVGLMHQSRGTMKRINGLCLRTADHVFIESEEQARRNLTESQFDTYQDKVTVFHKGIDVDHFDPNRFKQSNSEYFRVGTAALINPRKGLEDFIDAAALVLNERSDVQFTIAGDPARENDVEYKAELERLVAEHGIEDSVEFLGWVEDMPAYLHTLDVFVLPSLNEGIPGAIREALAMEVPVVATDVGGTPEAVIPGKTGFLVEPKDADQIAERIVQLLRDQSLRKDLGKRGRSHMIENFSIESYVRHYEDFIQEVAREG